MITGFLAFFAAAKSWPWGLIWRVALVVAILATLFFSGRYLYDLGARDERALMEAQIAAIREEASKAIAEEAAAFRTRTRALDRALSRAQQSLETVPDEADAASFLTAYARADRSLHDGAPG